MFNNIGFQKLVIRGLYLLLTNGFDFPQRNREVEKWKRDANIILNLDLE
jgi:hypothetical protein